jgi:uncharacterized GH25 family protein
MLVVAAILLVCPASFAHDLYFVKVGNQICARVGEHFPESMNAMPPNRLDTFTVNGQALKPVLQAAKKQTCAPLPANTKQGVVAATVSPVFIRLEPKDFQEYITAEGLNAAITGRAGKEHMEGRELYSRYAKTLIGANGETATKALGHVLEIVPETDPSTLKPGEPLPVKVMFRGQPLPGVKIAAMYAGAKTSGHAYPVSTTTDAEGRAVLKLDRPGLWYARLIHMVPSGSDPDFDWRSFFATLVFETQTK